MTAEQILRILIDARDNASGVLEGVGNKSTGVAGRIKSSYEAAVPASRALLFGLAGALGTVAVAGIGTGIKLAASMEQTKIAFTTMLGSASEADKFVKQMWDFAAKTPFEFEPLLQGARSLMAMGFAAKDVLPTLRNVGDAAAGLGLSSEGVQRIVVALGQMKAKGAASGEEMRQLAEAGIPAWRYLAKSIGTDIPTAMKMAESKAINGEQAINAILSGMGKDFGGLMEKQSQSIAGLWSTTKDNVSAALRVVGEETIKAFDLKGLLNKANTALSGFSTLLQEKGLKGALAELFPPETRGRIVLIAGAITGALLPAIINLGVGIVTATAPLLPWIAVGAALAAVGYYIYQNWDKIKAALAPLKPAWDGVKAAALAVWDVLKPFLQWAWDTIKSSFVAAIDNLKQAWANLQPILKPLLPLLKLIGAALLIMFVAPLLLVVGAVVLVAVGIAKLMQGFSWIAKMVPLAMTTAWNAVKTAWTAVANFFTVTIPGAIGKLLGWFASLPGRVAAFLASLPSRIGFIIGRVIHFFATLPGRVATWLVNMKNRAVTLFNNTRAAVVSAVSNLVSRVVSFFQSLPGKVVAFITSLPGRMSTLWNRVKTSIVTAVTGAYNAVRDKFTAAKDTIIEKVQAAIDWIKGLPGKLYKMALDIGGEFVRGLLKGLRPGSPTLPERLFMAIEDRATSAVATVRRAASHLAGVGNPAVPVLAGMGGMMGGGSSISNVTTGGATINLINPSFPGVKNASDFYAELQALQHELQNTRG